MTTTTQLTDPSTLTSAYRALVMADSRLEIAYPGDDEYDEVRAAFNVLTDQRPVAIALPRNAEQVAEAIVWARDRGLRVAPQATAHGAGSLGDLSDSLIVSTSRLDEIHIDAAACRVRVGTAVKWERVCPQLSDLGLAALHGSSPDVGIAGYSLGGGIGWLARKHGMQTNAVTALEVVTADGRILQVSADSHPELFWALRGGNGNFGVVTSIEFAVYPVETLYSGALFFPVEAAEDVLSTWSRLLPELPEELTTWVTLLHFPPMEEVPEPFRGQSFVIVMGAFLGSQQDGEELLRPFRAFGPVLDTFAEQPPSALATLAMDPESPVPFHSTTALLDDLSAESIASIAELSARGSALTMVQLRHVGGALNRAPEGAGARATLPGQIVLFSLGVVPDPALDPVVHDQLARLDRVVSPHKVGDYPNFVERPADASAFFDDATWARLRAVKAAYDPKDLMRGNHPIPPAV